MSVELQKSCIAYVTKSDEIHNPKNSLNPKPPRPKNPRNKVSRRLDLESFKLEVREFVLCSTYPKVTAEGDPSCTFVRGPHADRERQLSMYLLARHQT